MTRVAHNPEEPNFDAYRKVRDLVLEQGVAATNILINFATEVFEDYCEHYRKSGMGDTEARLQAHAAFGAHSVLSDLLSQPLQDISKADIDSGLERSKAVTAKIKEISDELDNRRDVASIAAKKFLEKITGEGKSRT